MADEINLMPWRYLKHRKKNRIIIAIFILLALILIISSLLLRHKLLAQLNITMHAISKTDLHHSHKEIKQYHQLEKKYLKYKSNQLIANEINTTLNMLEQLLPENIWLASLQRNNNTWFLRGYADDYKTVNVFYKKLRADKAVSSLTLNNTASAQETAILFTINFKRHHDST